MIPTPARRAHHIVLQVSLVSALAFGSFGCAFNIVSVRQTPAQFAALDAAPKRFTIANEMVISIGTGFRTHLKQGTEWVQIGTIAEGDVYRTRDQIVTVEASHISEAYVVVSGKQVVGFYLPVEKTFAPSSAPYPLDILSSN